MAVPPAASAVPALAGPLVGVDGKELGVTNLIGLALLGRRGPAFFFGANECAGQSACLLGLLARLGAFQRTLGARGATGARQTDCGTRQRANGVPR